MTKSVHRSTGRSKTKVGQRRRSSSSVLTVLVDLSTPLHPVNDGIPLADERQRRLYLNSGGRGDVLREPAPHAVDAANPIWLWHIYRCYRVTNTSLPNWLLAELDAIANRLTTLAAQGDGDVPHNDRVLGSADRLGQFERLRSQRGPVAIERFLANPKIRKALAAERDRPTTPGGLRKDSWKARLLGAFGLETNRTGGTSNPIRQWVKEREDVAIAECVRVLIDGDGMKEYPALQVVSRELSLPLVRVRRAWKQFQRVAVAGCLELQRHNLTRAKEIAAAITGTR